MRVCPKCLLQTDEPEGSAICWVYHGREGEGYCPIFVDGRTRMEQAALGPNGGQQIKT